MPTGIIMQARPRTLNRIASFYDGQGNYDLETHQTQLKATGLSMADLVNGKNQYSSDVLAQFLPNGDESQAINHVYKTYHSKSSVPLANNCINGQEVCFGQPGTRVHMDGILRDIFTNELFDFIAIGIPRVDEIREGSRVQYNREYSGVYEVILDREERDLTSIARYVSVFQVISV